MRIAATLFFLLSFLLYCSGQDKPSLLAELDTTTNDTTRIQLNLQLGASYIRKNFDSARHFIRQAEVVGEKMKYTKGQASIWNLAGNLHFTQSNYDSALYFYTIGHEAALQIADSLRQGALLNNIGMVLTYKAQFDTSVIVLLKALEMRRAINDPKASSTVNNLGNAYNRMGDLDKALEYYKEAAQLKEETNQIQSLSNTLNNIGIILKQQGKYIEAIPYYERSLAIAIDFDDEYKQANAHNNLATLYRDGEPQDNKKSAFHFEKAIELKARIGDKGGLFNSYVNYAELLSDIKRSKEALYYLDKAEKLEKELGKTMYTGNGLQMKAFVLSDLGRYQEAYEMYRKAYINKVQEVNEDRNEKIAEWETKYETAQKEAEIERLELEGQLKDANLSRSRNAQIGITSTASLLIISIVVFYRTRQKKQQAENETQELQLEAMKKRLMELNISTIELEINYELLNSRLHTTLSEREYEVLKLSLDGKSNSEISEALFISVSTVKFHLRNTYSKLGVSNRKEAFRFIQEKS